MIVASVTRSMVWLLLVAGTAGITEAAASAESTDEIKRPGTLDVVRSRGALRCGLEPSGRGFAAPDGDQGWSGFDVDFCRAVAAALFGDADSLVIVPVERGGAYQALGDGDVDLLARHGQPTFDQAAAGGLAMVAMSFHDGLAIMVRENRGTKTVGGLAGSEICVAAGSLDQAELDAHFASRNLVYSAIARQSAAALRADYLAGRCAAYAAGRAQLAALRAGLPRPPEHVILPKSLSKRPQGPLVRQGDDRWADIVRWTLGAMLIAEERGIVVANVDDMRSMANHPDIRRLLGVDGDYGAALGLSKDWAYDIIKQVGNYAEIYDRNLGPETKLALARGANALWSNGGILFAPPFR